MPAAVLRRRVLERRVRVWGVVCGLAAAAGVVPVGLDVRQQSVVRGEERKEAGLADEVVGARERLSAVVQRTEALRQQLARADALRAKNPWASLLTTVGRALPEEVWLSALATSPAAPTGDGVVNIGPAPGQQTVVIDAPKRLRLDGYALDHSHLYQMMSALNNLKVFGRVELAQADTEPMLRGQAVRFELECEW